MAKTVLLVITALLFGTCYCDDNMFEPPRPLPQADPQVTTGCRLALEAVSGITLRLQVLLKDDPAENFLVSPISAAVTVGQLVLGSDGEFRQQLVELLSLPDGHLYENDVLNNTSKEKNVSLPYSTLHLQFYSLLKALEGQSKEFVFKQKSALFFSNELRLKDDFKRNVKYFYSANLRRLDFAKNSQMAQMIMNRWAQKNTNGLIKYIYPTPPSPTTASVFANAVYFKAEWETPFSDFLNNEGQFNISETRQTKVMYMMGALEQIPYAESDSYTIISLPYKGDELGMYMILPKPNNPLKYDIKSFVQTFKFGEILATMSNFKRRSVVVKMPKMSLSHSFSILEQLKKYKQYKKQQPVTIQSRDNTGNGLDKLADKIEAFNNFTDKNTSSRQTHSNDDILLSNAALVGDLKINDLVQQIVLSVNEKGTEAAAVTATTIDYMGGSKNFVVNRPFAFFIRHEVTSAILFWGTISNPMA